MAGEQVTVIGGSSGIGAAIAQRMSQVGAHVTIVGRDPGRLAAAAARHGGLIQTVSVDATDPRAVAEFFATVGRQTDHLVLSFSTGRAGGPFQNLSMDELVKALTGKLVAYLSVLQAALPHLRPDGSVTFVGAGSAEAALPGTVGLAAVNGGVHAAVRPLAAELGPLRVNAVAPGVIDTTWWASMPEPVREGIFDKARKSPAGRVGTVDDVARVVQLLIQCDYVTGAVVPCDGGLRL